MAFEQSEWIRCSADPEHRNRFWCFRKNYKISEPVKLRITADSRYFLYINGVFEGTGPIRFWPESPYFDEYDIAPLPESDVLTVAVMVWHYGTSTSQYIHAPGGLIAELTTGNGTMINGTGSDWQCTTNTAYEAPAPRINVSQPWLELIEGDRFPDDWMIPEFDDIGWEMAEEIFSGFEGRQPVERPIPPLGSEKKMPLSIINSSIVEPRGQGFRIDYKNSFYPGDTSTEDRLHSGFICTGIYSSDAQEAVLTLLDRKWPLGEEFFSINGKRYSIPADEKEMCFPLNEGNNLFMLDISGACQRYWSDIHFNTEKPVTFKSPLPAYNEMFLAAGPFETFPIGNIVCSDGFSLNMEHRDYIKFVQCGRCEDLLQLEHLFSPPPDIFSNLPKHLGLMKNSSPNPDSNLSEIFKTGVSGTGIRLPGGLKHRELIVDMGEEVSGFLEFRMESNSPVVLEILFFEYLREGRVPEIPDDLDTSLRIRTSEKSYKFRSVLRRGFRYMQISLRSPDAVLLEEILVNQLLYPTSGEGVFKCSDRVLNEIDTICLRTLKLCREDTFVDCPTFEQALWLGDIYSMSRSNHMCFRAPELIEHTSVLTSNSLNHSFLPDCHLPAGLHLQLTAWSLFWIIASADHVRRTGRKNLIAPALPSMILTLEHFMTFINSRGLLEIAAWNMLDWAEMDTPYRGVITHQNALLVRAIEDGIYLSDLNGENIDHSGFRVRIESLKKAIDNNLWDKDNEAYRDSIHDDRSLSEVFSIQTNLIMLYCGCVPPHKIDAVKKFIITPPESAVKCGSPFLAGFLLEFLFREGLAEKALLMIADLWGPMLAAGSTTCWETFGGFYTDRLTRSYCHGWSCSPAELFRRYILGIPEDAGKTRKIVIAPVPGGLNHAEGSFPLAGGELWVSWSLTGGAFFCKTEYPKGYEVEVQPPGVADSCKLEKIERR